MDEHTRFVFHRVPTTFDPSASFSEVTFHIEACLSEDGLSKMGGPASSFFEWKGKLKPEHSVHLEAISKSRSRPWPQTLEPPTGRHKEKVVIRELCSILVPLCRQNEVNVEWRQRDLIPLVPGIKASYIGIGSLDTWHGTPDIRVRGVEMLVRSVGIGEKDDIEAEVYDSQEEDSQEEDTVSDGGTTSIEVKCSLMVSQLPQAVATCVVSSFTERNNHPLNNSAVPVILFARDQFRVILYDCVKDVLLISEPKLLSTKQQLSRSASALLWLVINHRYVNTLIPIATHARVLGSHLYLISLAFSTTFYLHRVFLKPMPDEAKNW